MHSPRRARELFLHTVSCWAWLLVGRLTVLTPLAVEAYRTSPSLHFKFVVGVHALIMGITRGSSKKNHVNTGNSTYRRDII
eukprot:1147670-Pelagomonas_calceolata.AAC.5